MRDQNFGNITPKNQNFIRIGVVLFIAFILLVSLSNNIFYTIPAGHAAVKFKRFSGGVDRENIYRSGFHVIAPWDDFIVYDTREQIKLEDMDVLSSNGLNIHVDVSVRFHPLVEKLGILHDEIGPDYDEKIVRDILRSSVRKVFGRYTPEEIYSTKREQAQNEIQEEVYKLLLEKNVKLETVLVRSIRLPQAIEIAIQEKLQQEQEAKKYEFRLQSEELEAQRKKIEAEGIRQFQEIVSKGISQDYLKWKGIETTEKLANSNNSKVIVIGAGKDGLPMILGNN